MARSYLSGRKCLNDGHLCDTRFDLVPRLPAVPMNCIYLIRKCSRANSPDGSDKHSYLPVYAIHNGILADVLRQGEKAVAVVVLSLINRNILFDLCNAGVGRTDDLVGINKLFHTVCAPADYSCDCK